jgi:protein arginine N-methyltransferase 1
VVKPGDVVLDLGTGTGLLAFLAVRAGADKVYAIEKTSIIEVAKANATKMGIQGKIDFITADSRTVDLPQRVDVIVSEVIGHLVVEENMLDSIIDARDRFLKPSGKLVPRSAEVYFVPVEADRLYSDEIEVWSKPVEGMDLSGSREFAANNIYLADFQETAFLSAPQVLRDLDLVSVDSIDMTLKASFEITRDGILHGLAGWFVARLFEGIEISTSPTSTPTHWKQCFLPINSPVEVRKGETISFGFRSRTVGDDVEIEWQIDPENSQVPTPRVLGRARSTLQNERSFSLRKLWLNNSTDRIAESVGRQITDLLR